MRLTFFQNKMDNVGYEHTILIVAVPVWRRHRRLIAPAFNQRVLNSYVPVFDRQSKILVRKLRNHVGNGEFEILRYLALCTLDMVFGELRLFQLQVLK